MNSVQTYLEPTQESGREYFSRGIAGRVVMLNLLRFRATADYSATPALAPETPALEDSRLLRLVEGML